MEEIIRELNELLKQMRPAQLMRLTSIARTLLAPVDAWRDPDSNVIVDEHFLAMFGTILQAHHATSAEPFTKDKFEHAMVAAYLDLNIPAALAPRGNPGHDISVRDVPWSLKTQADRSIKRGSLHISKFMELGRGQWIDEHDLAAMRDRMLKHMEAYERIFTLRYLSANKDVPKHEYELVEIPKTLLQQSVDGRITMQHDSGQNPKPGYCTVTNSEGTVLFQLYFDGGTERKLQVKNLLASTCRVHATWRFNPID